MFKFSAKSNGQYNQWKRCIFSIYPQIAPPGALLK